MKAKTIIQILLAVLIVGLAYVLYDSIMKPVRFDTEYTKLVPRNLNPFAPLRKPIKSPTAPTAAVSTP